MTFSDSIDTKSISLVDSLRGEWLKVPEEIMRDVGPAAQTFAGLLKITDRETFVSAATIASAARLPLRTCNRHLVVLRERGWIENRGREKTRGGIPRRTCTLAITKQARDKMTPWYPLPWWACCGATGFGRRGGFGHLPWSAKAVLSIIMGRLMTLASAAQREERLDEENLLAELSNWGFDDRFKLSLKFLQSATGLERQAIIAAKKCLHANGIIRLNGDKRTTDSLIPDESFGIVVTYLPNNLCRLKVSRNQGV